MFDACDPWSASGHWHTASQSAPPLWFVLCMPLQETGCYKTPGNLHQTILLLITVERVTTKSSFSISAPQNCSGETSLCIISHPLRQGVERHGVLNDCIWTLHLSHRSGNMINQVTYEIIFFLSVVMVQGFSDIAQSSGTAETYRCDAAVSCERIPCNINLGFGKIPVFTH